MTAKRKFLIFGSLVALGLVIGVGAVLLRPAAQPAAISAPFESPGASPSPDAVSPTASALPTSPSPSPSRKPSPKPSAKPKPKPKPPPKQPGPPPPPPPPTGCTGPHYEGTNAPKSEVESALEAAAARRFWTQSNVTLPVNLIKGVAMHESGWQSAIIACDGGIGTMQVMPGTVSWMNQRFGTSFNPKTLDGNTMLGSEYLQWMIKYFADSYDFDEDGVKGEYNIDPADCSQFPDVPDHREWCLLNAVISGYQAGYGAVDREATDGDETYFTNHGYIENVRAQMTKF